MTINPEFVERYQLLYKKDPTSKVFAPLVEAYRRMGLLDEALDVGSKGVSLHPTFASGRIALARALMDRELWKEACDHLTEACELSPENLLAHNLLGETYLKLRNPKLALRAFKMALFLNAQDDRARNQVARLESLTADEYEEDLFAPTKLEVVQIASAPASPEFERELQRILSLTDAFLGRNDSIKAQELVQKALSTFGEHPQLLKRWEMLKNLQETEVFELETPLAPYIDRRAKKIKRLQSLLRRINTHRLTRLS